MRIRITSAQFWANAGTLPDTLDLRVQYPAHHLGRLETDRFDWAVLRPVVVAACGGELAFLDASVVMQDRIGQILCSPEHEHPREGVRRLDLCGLALAASRLLSELDFAKRQVLRDEAVEALALINDRMERLYAAELSVVRDGGRLTGSDLSPRDRAALRRYVALGL